MDLYMHPRVLFRRDLCGNSPMLGSLGISSGTRESAWACSVLCHQPCALFSLTLGATAILHPFTANRFVLQTSGSGSVAREPLC